MCYGFINPTSPHYYKICVVKVCYPLMDMVVEPNIDLQI